MNQQIVFVMVLSTVRLALFGLAFNVVYFPTRVFPFALAGLYALAAHVAYSFVEFGAAAAVILGSVTAVIVSRASYAVVHRPLRTKTASPMLQLLASLSLFILLTATIELIWRSTPLIIRAGLTTQHYAGVTITLAQLWSLGVMCPLLAITVYVLQFTVWGISLRALASNPGGFAMSGHDPTRTAAAAFTLGGFLCSVVAISSAFDSAFDAHSGEMPFLLAVAATIIGGRRNILGPLIGACVLILATTLMTLRISDHWTLSATFMLVLLILILRPFGLVPTSKRPGQDV